VCSRAREDPRSDSDTRCRRFMAAALTTSPCPVPASRETVAPAGGTNRQYNRGPVAADAWRTLVAANAPATAPKRRIVLRMDAVFRPLGCAQTTASHKRGLGKRTASHCVPAYCDASYSSRSSSSVTRPRLRVPSSLTRARRFGHRSRAHRARAPRP